MTRYIEFNNTFNSLQDATLAMQNHTAANTCVMAFLKLTLAIATAGVAHAKAQR